MSKFLRNFKNFQLRFQKAKVIFTQRRNFKFAETVDPPIERQQRPRIGPLGWSLLLIPVSTFGLGTWQVQRKQWKENLIKELQECANSEPVDLPSSFEELAELEYRPVRVKGHFLHDKEIYLGPRSLLKHGDAATASALISKGGRESSNGYLVITPFKLSDREETILVNRGWVPHKQRDPKTRAAAQIDKEVNVIGVVRMHESRPVFMPTNREDSKCFLYRDLVHMSNATGADPIFLDATDDFDIAGGPIGGQTRITLRNEHLSYILTWYCLSATSGLMWYINFIKGIRI